MTLPELLVVVALAAMMLGLAAPAALRQWQRAALRAAAFDLAGQVRQLRHRAIARTRYEALRFALVNGRWTAQRLVDGNRNGIRAVDLARGVDTLLGPKIDLQQRWSGVRPALPRHRLPRIPPSRGFLEPGSDPIRLSGTDRISCAPSGSCTGGSIYLSAGGQDVAAVVIFGVTGRVRVWRFEPETTTWIRY